jgi:hypothetical protein
MFPGRFREIPLVCLFATVKWSSKMYFIGIIYFCNGRDRLSTRVTRTDIIDGTQVGYVTISFYIHLKICSLNKTEITGTG